MTRGPAAILVAALSLLLVGVSTLFLRTSVDDPAPVATPTGSPTESLEQQVQRVAGIVAQIRELEFVERPQATVLTSGELAGRIASELADVTGEEVALDQRILSLLGATPAGADLEELLVTALSEQVAGFYDPATGELVVGADDPTSRVGRIEELTLAHELEHALADQVHGLPEREPLGGLDQDSRVAVQSLIEGDATVTMQEYLRVGLSTVDQLLLAGEAAALAGELADLSQLPHYLEESLLFPYTAGAAFVTSLRQDGGWAAVDAAYARPPISTAQVLFPEVYAAGTEPVALPAPAPLGAPWRLDRSVSFGAADLLLLLQAPDGDPDRGLPDARSLTRTWSGGRADLFTDGDRSALLVTIASTDVPVLCRGLERWLKARDTTGIAAILDCDDDRIRLASSPDATAARGLAADGR